MKYFYIPLFCSVFILTACDKPAEEQVKSSNDNFNVEKLFTVDSCNMYRFEDAGRYIYFSNCAGITQWRQSCGKNCTRDVGVPTDATKSE